MKMKKLLSLLLCLCMLCSMFSMGAFADDFEPEPDPNTQPGTESGSQPDFEPGQEPEPEPQPEPDPQPEPEPKPEPESKPEPEPEPEPQDDSSIPSLKFKSGSGGGVPAPADLSVSIIATLTGATETVYNGNDQIGIVTLLVKDSNGNTLTKGTHYSVEREEVFKNAGTYKITAVGMGDYAELRSNTVSFTIKPASIPVSANNTGKTFGDSEPTLSYSVAGEYAELLSGQLSRESGENAGSYAITQGSLESTDANYAVSFTPGVFTISPKTVSPVAEYTKNHEYTGSQICPQLTLYTDSSKSSVIPTSEYNVSYEENLNVGPDALINVSDKDGGNYIFSEATGPYDFVIEPAKPVYTAPTAKSGLQYNGSSQQLINPGSVESPGCVIQYSNKADGTYSTSIPTGTKAGTYYIYYKIVSSNANYTNVGPLWISSVISAYTAGDEVADMIRALRWLPDLIVDPGNNHQRSEVLKVWNAYHALSWAEKQKVPAELYDWLYYLVASTDYAILSGSGSNWYKGKSTGISFHAIDPKQKFAGVRVDGELIDSSNYGVYWYGDNAYGYEDVVVVTLKPSYLTELGFGKHSITICYWNGYAPGHFYVMEASGSPPTGDSANFPLWSGMMLLSAFCLAGAGTMLRRRKNEE